MLKKNFLHWVALVIVVACWLCPRALFAQQGAGVLTGTVSDAPTKQPLADVVVTATSPVDPNDAVYALVLQPDGSIVAAGILANGNAAAPLARFSSSGALDTTFGSSGWAYVSGLSYITDLVIHPNSGGEFDVSGVHTILTPSRTDSAAVARLQPLSSRLLILGAAGGALGFRVLTESESAPLFDEPGQEGAGLSEPDPGAMRSAVGLVWRALVLWMILLLLLTTATFL